MLPATVGAAPLETPEPDTKICPASPNLRLVEACPEMQAQRQPFTDSHDLLAYYFLAFPLHPCEMPYLAQPRVLPPRQTEKSRLHAGCIFDSQHPSWCR